MLAPRYLAGALTLAALGPISPSPRPVSYLTAGSSNAALWRVVGDKVEKRYPLGGHVFFGATEQRLVMVSKLKVTVLDLATGEVVSERPLTTRGPRGWTTPVHEDLVLKASENAVYFLTEAGDDPDTVAYGITRLDLSSGEVATVKTPESGRLFDVPDGVGLCGVTSGYLAVAANGKLRTLRERAAEATEAACLHVPGVGIVRLTVDGKLEAFGTGESAGPPTVGSLGSRVRRPQPATLDGKPVIVYGELVEGAQGSTAVSALVAYDPAAGREVWRKKLPWYARDFAVSPNAGHFALMPLVDLTLTDYDRAADTFRTSLVGLKPADLRLFALVALR